MEPAAPMLDDVQRQPRLLLGLASRLDEIDAFWQTHLSAGVRTIAFGSGDGWFAARSVAGRPGQNGIVAASGLEIAGNQGPLLTQDDCLIAISMSGNVDRTVEAAAHALKCGARVVSLTNSDGGRLAELGLPNFSLEIDDVAPFMCGTSSFTATRTVLSVFNALSRRLTHDTIRARLLATAEALDTVLAQTGPRTASLAQEKAQEARGLRYLSCGDNGIAMADYGAAKIVELAGTPVWSDDIEEFAHRQYWTTERGEVAVMLPTSPFVSKVADDAANALLNMQISTVGIGSNALALPAAKWRFGWPDDELIDDATLGAGVMQLLAYHWSLASGFDPNKRMHLKNDTTRFKTSRLLTRRSLYAVAGDPQTAV